jgi:hypothetical protein
MAQCRDYLEGHGALVFLPGDTDRLAQRVMLWLDATRKSNEVYLDDGKETVALWAANRILLAQNLATRVTTEVLELALRFAKHEEKP